MRLHAQEKAGRGPVLGTEVDPSSPEKDQAQAQERSRRNHILKAMQRVPEASLPDFQDLPILPPVPE